MRVRNLSRASLGVSIEVCPSTVTNAPLMEKDADGFDATTEKSPPAGMCAEFLAEIFPVRRAVTAAKPVSRESTATASSKDAYSSGMTKGVPIMAALKHKMTAIVHAKIAGRNKQKPRCFYKQRSLVDKTMG